MNSFKRNLHHDLNRLDSMFIKTKFSYCSNDISQLMIESRDYVRGGAEGALAPPEFEGQKGEQKEKQTIHY